MTICKAYALAKHDVRIRDPTHEFSKFIILRKCDEDLINDCNLIDIKGDYRYNFLCS